jgi:hypothetical protein
VFNLVQQEKDESLLFVEQSAGSGVAMTPVIPFPMATKPKPKNAAKDPIKGVRMAPTLIRRIEEEGRALGITGFSEQVRFFLHQGMAATSSKLRSA